MNQAVFKQQPAEPNDLRLVENTWLIADTHFFRANIARYRDRPDGWQE